MNICNLFVRLMQPSTLHVWQKVVVPWNDVLGFYILFLIILDVVAVYECNFTSDFCDMTNSDSDDFNWIRAKKRRSFGTGPVADHTNGTGL